MNIDAINQNEDDVLKNYSTEGPEKPKLDLPFGFLFEQLGENGTGP